MTCSQNEDNPGGIGHKSIAAQIPRDAGFAPIWYTAVKVPIQEAHASCQRYFN